RNENGPIRIEKHNCRKARRTEAYPQSKTLNVGAARELSIELRWFEMNNVQEALKQLTPQSRERGPKWRESSSEPQDEKRDQIARLAGERHSIDPVEAPQAISHG